MAQEVPGNDFTSDLDKNVCGTCGTMQWVEEVNGAEEMNTDEETILKRLSLNNVEDIQLAIQSLSVKIEFCLC